MKKQLSEGKITERKKLVEFIAKVKKKSAEKKPAQTDYCRIIYYTHANYEEEDYTYGFK